MAMAPEYNTFSHYLRTKKFYCIGPNAAIAINIRKTEINNCLWSWSRSYKTLSCVIYANKCVNSVKMLRSYADFCRKFGQKSFTTLTLYIGLLQSRAGVINILHS